jgi:hypothetical protein
MIVVARVAGIEIELAVRMDRPYRVRGHAQAAIQARIPPVCLGELIHLPDYLIIRWPVRLL